MIMYVFRARKSRLILMLVPAICLILVLKMSNLMPSPNRGTHLLSKTDTNLEFDMPNEVRNVDKQKEEPEVLIDTKKQNVEVIKATPKKAPVPVPVTQEDVFKQRKQRITEGCSTYSTPTRCFFHAFGKTLVDPDHKTLFCEVFKVGSSNWMRTFMALKGKLTPDFRKQIDLHYKHLNQYKTKPERDEIIATYTTKFMFVRHPFSRVISCFSDKMEHDPDEDFISRHLAQIEQLTGKRPEKLDFPNFVSFIVAAATSDEKIDKLDPHFKPMYRMCCPCEIDYDYVGHLETLVDDSEYILKKMGANYSYPKSDPIATNSSSTARIERYFNQLTPEQVMGLYKVYELDFKLFGYEFPDYLRRPGTQTTGRERAETILFLVSASCFLLNSFKIKKNHNGYFN